MNELDDIFSWMGFPDGSVIKNPPIKQETWVWSLSREDPLEKEMATSILAWEIPWSEEPGGLQSMESQRVRHDLVAKKQQQQQHLAAQERKSFTKYPGEV